ncbi:glycosyltransferase [Microgenomates group bacterium]|nr:glycosyltransferase [Microgenomates group bacterium]
MKILLVTPIALGSADPHYFWFKALKQLGHQVKIFPLNHFPMWKPVKSWQLQQEILKFNPDKVFFSGGVDAVYPIKDTVFFSGVAPEILSAAERKIGQMADLVVTNDPSHIQLWQDLKAKRAICLPISAVDAGYYKPAKIKPTIPVSFVGSLFSDRQPQLAQIAKLYPKLKIWGWLPPQAKLLPQLKANYQGEAWGKQVVQIYQKSLIGLNLAPRHLPQAGNLRTFEIPACQALLLSDRLNPDWYLAGKEAVVFETPQDCVRKIHYYLNHPKQRTAIALKGFRRTIKDHTYLTRFSRLIADIKLPALPSV